MTGKPITILEKLSQESNRIDPTKFMSTFFAQALHALYPDIRATWVKLKWEQIDPVPIETIPGETKTFQEFAEDTQRELSAALGLPPELLNERPPGRKG